MSFPAKISTGDLAKLLGISEVRVNQLATEGVLAKVGRDTFEAAKSVKAYILYRENVASSEAGRHHGLSRERAQMVKTQRELAQLELDARLGNTVLITDAQAIIARCLVTVKNRLLALGGKLGPLANPGAPLVAQQVIYDGVCECLEELSTLETYNGGRTDPPPPSR